MSVLITTEELAQSLDGARPPRLLDVRWSLLVPDGRDLHAAGHLPGAVYADLENELSSHGEPVDGRHPLPSREQLQAAARAWGIGRRDAVVVYDDGPGIAAARAWWLLRHAGVVDVRILDGGLAAWTREERRLETGVEAPAPGDVELTWGALPTIDIDQAAAFPKHGVLLDARAAERFRGEVEPIDPIPGHIPGALNAPTQANVGEDGRFRDLGELRARFAALGVDGTRPVAVYCGSGVTAAHEIAALQLLGIEAALYPGSWSQWSNTADRPVATGDVAQEVSA